MNIIKKIVLVSVIGLTAFCLYSYISQEIIDQKKFIKNIVNYPLSGNIIKRCQKDYNYTNEDMVILEKELKKYFVLAALKTEPGSELGMYSKDVDNLWHTFILFTKEYADFCKTYIHHFVHHVPEIDTDKSTPEKLAKIRQTFHAFVKSYEATFHEEVHPIWFLDICEKNEENHQRY